MVVTGLVFIGVASLLFVFWLVVVSDCRYLGVPGVSWIYDRFARFWNLDEPTSASRMRAEANLALQPFLDRAVTARARTDALDVATGTGRVALLIAGTPGFQGKVVGVDVSRNMLARGRSIARSKGLEDVIELVEGDAAALAYPDESFDLVTCVDAPLPDLRKTLSEMVRLLRPGGHLLYTKQSDRWGYLTPGKSLPASKTSLFLERKGLSDIEMHPWGTKGSGSKGQVFFATKGPAAGNVSRTEEVLAKVRSRGDAPDSSSE